MMEFGDALAWVLQRKTQLKAPALQGTCIMLAVLDHLWIVTIVSTKYNTTIHQLAKPLDVEHSN